MVCHESISSLAQCLSTRTNLALLAGPKQESRMLLGQLTHVEAKRRSCFSMWKNNSEAKGCLKLLMSSRVFTRNQFPRSRGCWLISLEAIETFSNDFLNSCQRGFVRNSWLTKISLNCCYLSNFLLYPILAHTRS